MESLSSVFCLLCRQDTYALDKNLSRHLALSLELRLIQCFELHLSPLLVISDLVKRVGHEPTVQNVVPDRSATSAA